MLRFVHLLRRAVWRAFGDNCFAIAKASAYSSILTFFPALLVVASVLAASRSTESILREIASGLGKVLPPGASATALRFVEQAHPRPIRLLVTTSIFTVLAASGIMISWMEGFRNAYRLPKIWGFWKERSIALLLVLLAFLPMTFATLLVGLGSQIEIWMVFHTSREIGAYLLVFFTGVRWLIATLTSIAVFALVYHYGVPRTQPWHRVLPGAGVATGLWFSATMVFASYVQNYATYSVLYGSLST
ncbi:MAG: YihY/virulence factor BrkB family protein, partial [Terriglobales bacterium]